MSRTSSRGRRPSARATRERHKRVLAVSGGIKTEAQYLDYVNGRVRSGGVKIVTAKSGRDPVSLVKEARELAAEDKRNAKNSDDPENVFNAIWVVFDVDDFADSIPEAMKLAKEHGIRCAISNPCFEVWLLWHVSEFSSHDTTKATQKKAKQQEVVGGVGGKTINLKQIEGNYNAARKSALNAERVHAEAARKFPHDNPRSDVHQLIDYVLESAAKARPSEEINL